MLTLHELIGDPSLAEHAQEFHRKLAHKLSEDTHDRGFLFYYSSCLGSDLLAEEEMTKTAMTAADSLAATFNRKSLVIPVGNQAEVSSGHDDVTIDCMMNLQLLWWAWERTGKAMLYEIANAHSLTTSNWHFRADGSVYQSVHFDPNSGDVTRLHNHQGYSDKSHWSRGLAWAIYGFSLAHKYTGIDIFRGRAQDALRFWVQNIPNDLVPFYDFSDPDIPNTSKDTSAAAIVCSAILRFWRTDPDLLHFGKRTLGSLISNYLTPVDANDKRPPGILASGCYNRKANLATNHELIWGDYYLLECLRTCLKAERT